MVWLVEHSQTYLGYQDAMHVRTCVLMYMSTYVRMYLIFDLPFFKGRSACCGSYPVGLWPLSATTVRPHLFHGVFSNACGQLVLHMAGCGKPLWAVGNNLASGGFLYSSAICVMSSSWQDVCVTVWQLVAVLTSILGCVLEVMK